MCQGRFQQVVICLLFVHVVGPRPLKYQTAPSASLARHVEASAKSTKLETEALESFRLWLGRSGVEITLVALVGAPTILNRLLAQLSREYTAGAVFGILFVQSLGDFSVFFFPFALFSVLSWSPFEFY